MVTVFDTVFTSSPSIDVILAVFLIIPFVSLSMVATKDTVVDSPALRTGIVHVTVFVILEYVPPLTYVRPAGTTS